MAVGKNFAQQRKRGRSRCGNFPDDAREIETEFGIVFARELLHSLVVGKARQMQEFQAAVARGEQRAFEQQGADAVALPWLFDRECGLRSARGSERSQLGGSAQRTIDEEAVDDG